MGLELWLQFMKSPLCQSFERETLPVIIVIFRTLPPPQMPSSSVPSIRGYGKENSVTHTAFYIYFLTYNSTSVILVFFFVFPSFIFLSIL